MRMLNFLWKIILYLKTETYMFKQFNKYIHIFVLLWPTLQYLQAFHQFIYLSLKFLILELALSKEIHPFL